MVASLFKIAERGYANLSTYISVTVNLPTFICSDKALGQPESAEVVSMLGQDSAADSHNPVIFMQQEGADYAASDVSCILCTNTSAEGKRAVSSLKMDISGAYGIPDNNAEVALDNANSGKNNRFSYIREASLIKGEGITVLDNYGGKIPFTLSLMTYEKPEISLPSRQGEEDEDRQGTHETTEKITSISVGDLGEINIEGPVSKTIIQEYKIDDERLGIAWHHSVYRILLVCDKFPDDGKCTLEIRVK